ncbi:MAG TPA: hypothetical protein VMU22_03485 [Rhizomicrobium sp.]|nr:hypothetical protein [Rhizomicrobium sp.]
MPHIRHRLFVCLAALAVSSAVFAGSPVQLQAGPPFAKANARLPRIVSPATPATARINAAFDKLDARWAEFMRGCPKGGETGRIVAVTMTGPQYFSVVVSDSEDCGGAHPDASTLALVYDLSTGKPVDWKTLLGPRAGLSTSLDTVIDGTRSGMFASAPLQALYLKSLKATIHDKEWWGNCGDVFADPLSFVVWPDTKKHALVLQPALAHVVQACAEDGAIGADDLRKIGASGKLVDALR